MKNNPHKFKVPNRAWELSKDFIIAFAIMLGLCVAQAFVGEVFYGKPI